MDPLKKRLFFASIFIAVALYAIFFSPNWFYLLIVETFVLLSLNEFFGLAQKKGIYIQRPLGFIFGALIPLTAAYSSSGPVLVAGCLALFLFSFRKRRLNQALVSTAVTVFGIIYIAWFLSYLIHLRFLDQGALWVFYLVLVVKIGDAAAYFVGKKYGKRKLLPHISPNKSVEGAIGGLAGTVLFSILSKFYLPAGSFAQLFILGLGLGVVAQLGDLAESMLKRDAGVKDSGQVPGLGGVLDVMDSLILTAPLLYYFITNFILHSGI